MGRHYWLGVTAMGRPRQVPDAGLSPFESELYEASREALSDCREFMGDNQAIFSSSGTGLGLVGGLVPSFAQTPLLVTGTSRIYVHPREDTPVALEFTFE